ncbi:hypothetical protein NKR23_g534 [Pleurostoma richardsiae]|uniref:Uncharacterized protein n=1 Tax=Pleurostoma richardsiae TaxID=41990 RepID=A0AA38SF50_9PEZI|nr:hypothetical protein NKR23_g534 [Pleurostoma richardsiae]
MLVPLALVTLLYLAGPAAAVSWYFLRFHTQASVISPGLQPTDTSGIYQNVLDGRTGTWSFSSGWYCSDLSWGQYFKTAEGESVYFHNFLLDDGSAWNSTIVREVNDDVKKDSFPLTDKTFDQVVFAIKLYDVDWDFGELVFKNVKIVAEGTTSTCWCTEDPENYNDNAEYSITNAKATVSSTTVTCTFEAITLIGPA